jgi:pilus assembly protein FimV
MSLILGEIQNAKSIAKQVVKSIDKNSSDYWSLATLGEAFLITEEISKSYEFYLQAVDHDSADKGIISSTFEQLTFLSQFIDIPDQILDTLRPPAVVVFSGHMIDSSDRKKPRFPNEINEKIKKEIIKQLKELNAGIGYCSAACGADILFIEAMLERGGEVNVYLPFAIEDFIETSIAFAGPDWIIRFHRIMLRVNVRYITEESYLGNDDLFQLLGKVIMGMTQLTAQLLFSEAYFLGVIEDSQEIKPGGSADLLNIWKRKKHVRIINPVDFIDDNDTKEKNVKNRIPSHISSDIPFGVKRVLKCILFADIVGFSKMEEEHTPFYMFELLETVSQSLKKLKQPEILNTWGDAIFAVFDDPEDCMVFALQLNHTLLNTDWSTRNLPSSINIRIALHTGPVFIGDDPITKKLNAYGTHINRAARIEPITVPGCIFCSEQYAALLLVTSEKKYSYRYIGTLELPKGFGTQEIYQINTHN